jgi:hypothetical protein
MSAVAVPITIIDPLADAIEVYIAAKRDEDCARDARLVAEERILALHPAKEEGSETFEAAGFKVTLTGKLTYKCDDARALAEACADWPASMVPIKTKVELDETGAKWLRANEPQAWAQIASYISVKPAKTAVKVAV